MRLYISGVHSGTNPSPGLGTARSLRIAFPSAELIAVDYSNRSSGIHHDVFDDVWLQLPWDQLNLELYSEQIRQILSSDDRLWISGLDLEVKWLAHNLSQHKQVLVPPHTALPSTLKPAITAHTKLPFSVPPYISISESDWSLHSFCRRFGWQVWLKSPYYEARRVRSWAEFEFAREELSYTWSTRELFLQAHVAGFEESITLCAYEGNLLDCVYMAKRDLTNEGKTWAGKISRIATTTHTALKDVIAELGWTGGAELEFVRDSKVLYLIDWNVRFPAWIYGATIAGHNLPAKLVSAACGEPFVDSLPLSQEFTRVVVEIPVRSSFPLPSLSESIKDTFGWSSKHPSGMPLLAKRFSEKSGISKDVPIQMQSGVLEELSQLDLANIRSPSYFTFGTLFRENLVRTIDAVTSGEGLPIRIAYSIKTNPSPDIIRIVLQTGLMAETISQLEVQLAKDIGFDAGNIILNGPAKYWPRNRNALPLHSLKAVFCDSLGELRNMICSNTLYPQVIGLRLRPPILNSRFGVPIDEPIVYQELINTLELLPSSQGIGVHFHFASNILGVTNWWILFESILEWAYQLEQVSQRRIICLDLGGGWFPDDWTTFLLPRLRILAQKAQQALPNLSEIICEPGKALVQPFGAWIVRILEIRKTTSGHKDILVDGAISDIPEAKSYPHRIAAKDNSGAWNILGKGDDRIIGRICMENDTISTHIHFPDNIREGDILAICDSGAYDRSMSYVFGQG